MNNTTHYQRIDFDFHQRLLITLMSLLIALAANARDIEFFWPKGKMPHSQPHQVAVMDDEKPFPATIPMSTACLT